MTPRRATQRVYAMTMSVARRLMRRRVSYVDALGRVYVPNNLDDADDIDAPVTEASATFTVMVPRGAIGDVASAVVQYPTCTERVSLQTLSFHGARHVGDFVVTATYEPSRQRRRHNKTLGVRLVPS